MAWNTNELHTILRNTCRESLGFAFEKSWLIRETQRLLRQVRASTILANGIQTPFGDIYITLDLHPETISIRSRGGQLILSGFQPVLRFLSTPARGSRGYAEVRLDYEDSPLKVAVDSSGKHLRFYSTELLPAFAKQSNFDQAAIEADGLDLQSIQRVVDEQMLADANVNDIFSNLVESLPFPHIKEEMRTFLFGGGIDYTSAEDLVIVFSATNREVDAPCSCGAGENMISQQRRSPTIAKPITGEVGAETNGASVSLQLSVEPADGLGSGPIDDSHYTPLAFYYPKEQTFDALFDGALRPALNVGDSGAFLCFHWFYNMTAAVRSLSIEPVGDIFPPLFHVTGEWSIFGGAGVDLKVGCIRTNLLHSNILGYINLRLDAQFYIVETNSGPSIRLATKANVDLDVDFSGPPLLDILLNIVMDSIFDRLIGLELSNRLSQVNVKLVDLGRLGAPYGWQLGASIREDSTLLVAGMRG
jgi:hypothetical protein